MKHKSPDRTPPDGVVRRWRRFAFAAFFVFAMPLAGQEDGEVAAPGNPVPVPNIGNRNDPGRSESSSRQFIVYGDDWRLRGDYCVLAEDVKSSFLRLFRLQDEWDNQVVIQLRTSLGGVSSRRPVEARAQAVAGGFRFVMRVEIGDSLSLDDVREELLHLLMYEFILKQSAGVKTTREALVIPLWMRVGIAGAIQYRQESTQRNSIYRAIFQSGKMLSIDEILKGRPADATSVVRALYDASAAGLLTTLLDQKDGIEKMKALLLDLLRFDGTDYALLKKHFPDLDRSNNSLEKWWALQIATLAEPTALDILGVIESDAFLQKALLVNFVETRNADGSEAKKKRRPLLPRFGKERPEKEQGDGDAVEEFVTCEVGDFERFIRRDDIERITRENEMKLMSLSYRAFPLYRPIIQEYQEVFEAIKNGKDRGLKERIDSLEDLRMQFLKMARDAEDYLHLYEATTPDAHSGAFDEYFKLFEKLHGDPPKREDAISEYLDKLDREWDE